MTTIATAFAALRTRAEAQITTMPLKWPNENNELPDTAEPFVYFDIDTFPTGIASFGGGRGANRYRNSAEFRAYVFVPVDWGMNEALTRGETVAAAFRSFRSDDVSCFGAGVHPVGKGTEIIPPGLESAAGNYACAAVIVDMFFDQIG
jgi:hypothetical protein